jgi:TPR repeat protein
MRQSFVQILALLLAVGMVGCAEKKAADQPLASAGFDDQALYEMGYAIKHITPVTPELTDMTLKLLRASAAMGNGEAMVQLGEMYLAGRVPLENGQDTNQEAMKWWNSAWEHGATRAYHNLGLLYYGVPVPGTGEKGVGIVEQNYAKAFQYFKAAADLNDAKAVRYVGISYENGQGVKQDYAEAAKYYEKNGGGYYLANLLLDGKGVKQDVTRAISIYQEVAAKEGGGSADQDSAEALARIYEQGRYVAADQNKALEYYQLAAAYGSSAAKARLTDFAAGLYKKGYALLKGGNYEAALPLLLKSANLGNADALKMTGTGKK